MTIISIYQLVICTASTGMQLFASLTFALLCLASAAFHLYCCSLGPRMTSLGLVTTPFTCTTQITPTQTSNTLKAWSEVGSLRDQPLVTLPTFEVRASTAVVVASTAVVAFLARCSVAA
jgi:hypothetical protein